MSKADLARALKISPSGVSDLLAENSWPTTRRLSQALEVLSASAHDLAWALDQVNQRSRPMPDSEVREAVPADPLDQLADSFHAQLRALVEEVKRRSPKS